MKQNRLFLLLLFFSLFVTVSAGAQGYAHVLKKGETLYSISLRYNVKLDSLIEFNQIEDPSNLPIGFEIRIPQSYIVVKGDTLFGISIKAGVSLTEFLNYNSMTQNDIIRPGDVLLIPPNGSLADNSGRTQTPSPITGSSSGNSSGNSSSGTSGNQSGGSVGTSTDSSTENQTSASSGTAVANSNSDNTESDKEPAQPALPQPSTTGSGDLFWPHPGRQEVLTGKLSGVKIIGAVGDPVVSVATGRVSYAVSMRGYGKVVTIETEDKLIYGYAGLDEVFVKAGDLVAPGDQLGLLGSSAHEDLPVVKFFVYRGDTPLNPATAPRK